MHDQSTPAVSSASAPRPGSVAVWVLAAICAAGLAYVVVRDYQAARVPSAYERLGEVMRQHREDEATRRYLEGR